MEECQPYAPYSGITLRKTIPYHTRYIYRNVDSGRSNISSSFWAEGRTPIFTPGRYVQCVLLGRHWSICAFEFTTSPCLPRHWSITGKPEIYSTPHQTKPSKVGTYQCPPDTKDINTHWDIVPQSDIGVLFSLSSTKIDQFNLISKDESIHSSIPANGVCYLPSRCCTYR